MPFIMTAAYELPIVYKKIEMLLIGLTDLFAVKINPNELDELFLRLIELLCIREDLYLDTEKQIIFHQIMDLMYLRSTIWWKIICFSNLFVVKAQNI
jgi:hypothetical protein